MMKNKMPSVKVNAILNSIRTIMTIIFPLITYPYVTRILKATNLGKVNYSSAIISYFALIAVLGLTSYAGREGQQYRNNKKKLNTFCGELFTLNLLTTMLSYFLLVITCIFVNKLHSYIGLLAIYSLTILFSTLGMDWLYTLHEDYLYITVRSIVMQLVSLVLLFLFVRREEDYYIYAVINVFASVGGNIFNFFHARKYIQFKLIFSRKIFAHLKSSLVFFSNSIASSIYSNIDITMLGLICGDYYVGIYSVSVRIYTMLKTLLVAVMSVTSPRLTFFRLNGMLDEYNVLLSKLIKVTVTFMFPVVVGINIVSKEVILVLCGNNYIESRSSLCILSIAIVGSIFASIANSVLLACRLEKKVLIGTTIAAVANLVTNIVFIPLFGQNGAAMTTALSEFIVLGIGFWYAREFVKFDNIGKIVITSGIGCIIMFFCALFIDVLIDNIFMLLICKVVSCAIVYFISLIVLKNEIVIDYYYSFKEKLKIISRK